MLIDPGPGVPGGPGGYSDQTEGRDPTGAGALQRPPRQGQCLLSLCVLLFRRSGFTSALLFVCFYCEQTGGGGMYESSLSGESPSGNMSSEVGAVSLHPGEPADRGGRGNVSYVCVINLKLLCLAMLGNVTFGIWQKKTRNTGSSASLLQIITNYFLLFLEIKIIFRLFLSHNCKNYLLSLNGCTKTTSYSFILLL